MEVKHTLNQHTQAPYDTTQTQKIIQIRPLVVCMEYMWSSHEHRFNLGDSRDSFIISHFLLIDMGIMSWSFNNLAIQQPVNPAQMILNFISVSYNRNINSSRCIFRYHCIWYHWFYILCIKISVIVVRHRTITWPFSAVQCSLLLIHAHVTTSNQSGFNNSTALFNVSFRSSSCSNASVLNIKSKLNCGSKLSYGQIYIDIFPMQPIHVYEQWFNNRLLFPLISRELILIHTISRTYLGI